MTEGSRRARVAIRVALGSAVVLTATLLLNGLAGTSDGGSPSNRSLVSARSASRRHVPLYSAAPTPAAMTSAMLDLHSGPVPIPIRLQFPTMGVDAPMTGVGLLPNDTMDAPKGPASDPVWDQAFWYRGSAIPGASSTAVVAGHIDGPDGRTAVFGRLDQLRVGDPIVVHDPRSNLDVHFSVTETADYTLAEAGAPATLERLYGVGPVAGTAPQPSADGLAHLTLITCSGTFRNGTHDHRLAVYAVRTG